MMRSSSNRQTGYDNCVSGQARNAANHVRSDTDNVLIDSDHVLTDTDHVRSDTELRPISLFKNPVRFNRLQ
jgi:hypothetical protein